MGGMMTSLTRLLAMVPNAPPMMIPTAMSTTLPLTANSLNSFTIPIGAPLRLRGPPARLGLRGGYVTRWNGLAPVRAHKDGAPAGRHCAGEDVA